MRFFLEFVACCGPTTQRRTARNTTSAQPLAAEEEERSLVSLPNSRTRHRKKRGRIGASAGPEWRPSLGSISENNIVPPRGDGSRNGKVGPEREVKRRSDAAAKVHRRNYGDDYKRAAVPTIIPPFSPTPFMF